MNLIPQKAGTSPHYWCTWMAQNQMFVKVGEVGGVDKIDEPTLMAPGGWLDSFHRDARPDLLVMCDAGWDLPIGKDAMSIQPFYGLVEPYPDRFPSLKGTPTERLAALHQKITSFGWRGTGVWIIAQGYGEAYGQPLLSDAAVADDYRMKAKRCADAGITYWKVDFGMRGEDVLFRRRLTHDTHDVAPGITVEHARNIEPLNGTREDGPLCAAEGVGRFRTSDVRMYRGGTWIETTSMLLPYTDILRTYDVAWALSVSTTVDRVATILAENCRYQQSRAVLNCEDEVYLAAALGCTMGVMRYPSQEGPKHIDPFCVRRRCDEVVRAVRWSRIAPPVPVNALPVTLSDEVLVDDWIFEPGELWIDWAVGPRVRQGAPAITARGLPLPVVECNGPKPFVVAMRHPNGATSVATLPRNDSNVRKQIFPRASVTVEADPARAPIGIFGHYERLVLRCPAPPTGRFFAQDLRGEAAEDITASVSVSGQTVTLSGDLIDRIGRNAATPGDESQPGMVLVLKP